MEKENKVRPMTDQEKEQFLKRVKIETEDIPTSNDPKEAFKQTLVAYQNEMIEQISRVSKMIDMHEYMRETLDNVYKSDFNRIDKDMLKAEIGSREEVIAKLRESDALMKERVKVGETLINECINNFEFLEKLDFFLGGGINLPTTEEYKKRVIDEYNK